MHGTKQMLRTGLSPFSQVCTTPMNHITEMGVEVVCVLAVPSLTPPLIFLPGEFMDSLQDPDLNVRRATLAFFNSAVHNKPSLVRDLLDDILPLLYQETKIRRDLIREVRPGRTEREPLDLTRGAVMRTRVQLIR